MNEKNNDVTTLDMDIVEIFNQLSILSAHVYAIEELLIDKNFLTEVELENKIDTFIEEVTEDDFELNIDENTTVH